jgi:adenylate cyclase
MSFLEELKRRNVFRVGIAYVVSGWLLLQVTDIILNNVVAPEWLFRTVVTVLLLGLPVALLFAWAFELTPEGVKRESEVDRSRSITPRTGGRLDLLIIAALVLALGFFAIDKFVLDPARDSEIAKASAAQVRSDVAAQAEAEAAAGNSIAVLPFADMSAAGDQQYFSDGIAEELLNALVRINGLKVASRTSSFAYRGSEQSLRDIAAELKVSHILEGSVRRAGQKVRITAQLIDTQSDRHLWSETYDRDLNDVLAIQDEIANAIVESMKTQLGLNLGEQRANIASNTDSTDAYDLYLKGRALILARADIDEAVQALEQAVSIDPEFAKAWEILGAAYFIAPSWSYEVVESPYEAAYTASQRALELDSSLALPWSVISRVGRRLGRIDWTTALEYSRRAIEADPNNATVQLWGAFDWAELGFPDKAQGLLQRCLELDPAYENCRRHLALIEYRLGHEDEALRLFQEGSENGFYSLEAILLPLILRRQGRTAAVYVATGLVSGQGFPVGDYINLLQYPEGDHTAARQRFIALKDNLNWRMAVNLPTTSVFYGLFDAPQSAAWDVKHYIWSPDLTAYRKSPEFKQFVANEKYEAYWREHSFPELCRPVGSDDFECD